MLSKFLSPVTPIVLTVLFLVSGWAGGAGNVFDYGVDQRFAEIRRTHPGLEQVAAHLTFFGSAYVTFGIAIVGAIWLLARDRKTHAALLIFGFTAERLAMDALKIVYARTRPSFDLHPVPVSSFSFPSGHASNSMAAFVLFALLAMPEKWRTPSVIVAVMLAATVALSRPFLGVHWPTDIMGGWCLAGVSIWVVMVLERRFNREPA